MPEQPVQPCQHVWQIERTTAFKEWRWCRKCFTEQERGRLTPWWTNV